MLGEGRRTSGEVFGHFFTKLKIGRPKGFDLLLGVSMMKITHDQGAHVHAQDNKEDPWRRGDE